MWRFIAAAAVIVAAIGSIVFARRAGLPDFRVNGRVSGTPTPTAERRDSSTTALGPTNFLGAGSWAMSSLPGCFVERERRRGTLAALRRTFPPASERIAAGTVLRRGDCTIVVGAHDLQIARGADRLRVPADAALFREPGGLTLVYVAGDRAEIRRY